MEKRIDKKRPSGASRNPSAGTKKSRAQSTVPRSGNALDVLGIELNPETARQAVILSEIIGKPVSKRGRRR